MFLQIRQAQASSFQCVHFLGFLKIYTAILYTFLGKPVAKHFSSIL